MRKVYLDGTIHYTHKMELRDSVGFERIQSNFVQVESQFLEPYLSSIVTDKVCDLPGCNRVYDRSGSWVMCVYWGVVYVPHFNIGECSIWLQI